MKHILDVSEKYAAMEIFESLCEILATESTREKKGEAKLPVSEKLFI
jgi:hypothetical protein